MAWQEYQNNKLKLWPQQLPLHHTLPLCTLNLYTDLSIFSFIVNGFIDEHYLCVNKKLCYFFTILRGLFLSRNVFLRRRSNGVCIDNSGFICGHKQNENISKRVKWLWIETIVIWNDAQFAGHLKLLKELFKFFEVSSDGYLNIICLNENRKDFKQFSFQMSNFSLNFSWKFICEQILEKSF